MTAAALMADPQYDKVTNSWLCALPDGLKAPSSMAPFVPDAEAAQLPVLPDGTSRLDLLEESIPGDDGVGGRVWVGAGAMCRFIRSNADLVRGASVLELGAGTGASGLYAACAGASRVALTDGGPPPVIDLLRRNVDKHAHLFTKGTRATAAHYRFGEMPLPSAPAESDAAGTGSSGGGFDVIIGSDITYSVRYDRDALARTLHGLLSRGGGSQGAPRVVLAHEHRRSTMFDVATLVENRPAARWDENDYALGIFLETASEHGLRVTPRLTTPGRRGRSNHDETVVHMTTDLSILEVELA